jgi:hypothetical protein
MTLHLSGRDMVLCILHDPDVNLSLEVVGSEIIMLLE